MTDEGGIVVRGPLRRIFIQGGGPGSGHHGHEGRPGKVGGSMPSTGSTYSLANDPDLGGSILREWYSEDLRASKADDDNYVVRLLHYVKTYKLTPAQSKKIRELGYEYSPRSFAYVKPFELYEADKEQIDDYRRSRGSVREPTEPYEVENKRLTKKAINEAIQMTSSRYNTYKKSEVVDTAYKMMHGEEWVRMNGAPETTPRELLRDVAGSDDIETRKVNENTFEVKVNQWVVDSGTYVVEGGAQDTIYLINGPERYIAEGMAGDSPDNFRYEYKRTYFGEQPVERGGEGSGHHGHEGRPGEVGGSKPSKGSGGAPGLAPPEKKKEAGGASGEGGKGEEGGKEAFKRVKPLPENREMYPPKTQSGEGVTSYGMEPEEQQFDWNENLDVVGQIPIETKREFMESLPADTRQMTVEQRWDLAKVLMDMPARELGTFYEALEKQPNIRDTKRGTGERNQALRLQGFRDVLQGVVGYQNMMANAKDYLETNDPRKHTMAENFIRDAPKTLEQKALGVYWWPDEAKTTYWSTMLSDNEPETEEKSLTERGGEGSGHHGHKGRPDEVGGSLPSGASGGADGGADADEGEVAGGMSNEELKTQYVVDLGGVRVPFDSKEQFEQIQEIAGGQLGHAQEIEPEITELVTGLAGQYGGDMSGLDRKIKSQESLTRKIRLDMLEKGMSAEDAANAINDKVRYTMLFSPETYVDNILQIQADLKEQGWSQYDNKWKNFWRPGDDYDGYHNIFLHGETGKKFELQFHTYESIAIKDKSHVLYNEIKELPEGDLRDAKYNEMRSLWMQEFEKPEGWEKLPGVLR